MRSTFQGVVGALLLAILAGCSQAEPQAGNPGAGGSIGGEGGSGGTGGVGGSGPLVEDPAHRAEVCTSLCDAMAACGDEDPACAAECIGQKTPTELYESCASCLQEQSCRGAPLACRGGVACDFAWDLRVTGTGLDELRGAPVRVLVVEAIEGELWVDFARTATVVGGGFDVEMRGALPFWQVPFDVVVLVDADRDGLCTPGVDAAWRREVGVPAGDAWVRVEGADEQTPDACAFWDAADPQIVLEGGDFDAWEGDWVLAASVWSSDTFLTASAFSTMQVEQGGFRLELGKIGDFVEEMAPGTLVEAVWMIDVDGDWVCTDADVGGRGPIPPVRGFEHRVETSGAQAGSAPCHLLRGLGHDVTLEGEGWDVEDGTAWQLVLLHEGKVTARRQGRVEGGRVVAAFERMATHGATYQAAVWIDRDGDGACAVPGDGAWAFEVGRVEADRQVVLPAPTGDADPALCTHFDLRALLNRG